MTPSEQSSNERPEAPPGFEWEFRCGYDGAGSYSEARSVVRTSTMYRRLVGRWEVDRPSREFVIERHK